MTTPQTRLATLSGRHNRAVTSTVWSRNEEGRLWAGYEKTRNEYSLALWDVEMSMSKPTTTTTGQTSHTNQPIQTLLPSEAVTSIETIAQSPHTILVSTAGRTIRLIDIRTPTPTTATSLGPTQSSITWQTKASHGLTSSEYLFAGYEDGLSGIVKVFDIRYPLSASGAATPLASQPSGGNTTGEVASFFAGGSVTGIGWRSKTEAEYGRGTLAVGMREGGVTVLDVVTMSGAREGMDIEGEEIWTGFTGCKKSEYCRDTDRNGDFR